ncbi:unnamed protein product [Pleuronectes platessa]|uniref:Uncharacterized protein n=1 Tax=Pleuronectes platessa TaxID=8262 RepID=A0A9N7YQF9_PLEPL|nr:unnamed protein product [Pleuronectes platessa]
MLPPIDITVHRTIDERVVQLPTCFVHLPTESSANVSATQSELISPVTAMRAADGKIAPRKSKPSSGAAGLQSPPVTYMHICETEVFSCSCCGPAPPYRCTSART